MFDFFITHRLEKINSVNTSLRQSNYKNKNESLNRLLLML